MLVKGEIQTVDYTGNTCVVRLPLFEAAGSNTKALVTATICSQPGLYNGYLPGDVVIIGFDTGKLEKPIVLGKLYLGVKEEEKTARGVLNCSNGTISESFSMPLNSAITMADRDKNIVSLENGAESTNSLQVLIDNVQKANNISPAEITNYKKSEQEVGTWTDGETIYRQVFKISLGSGVEEDKITNTNIVAQNVINCKMTVLDKSNAVPFVTNLWPGTTVTAKDGHCRYKILNNEIEVSKVGNILKNNILWVTLIIEYTKPKVE